MVFSKTITNLFQSMNSSLFHPKNATYTLIHYGLFLNDGFSLGVAEYENVILRTFKVTIAKKCIS